MTAILAVSLLGAYLMLIWGMYAILFIYGIVVVVTQKIKLSSRRHVIGGNAILVGVGLMLLPAFSFGSAVVIGVVGMVLQWHPDKINNWSVMGGLACLIIPALIGAVFLNRLSVPIEKPGDKVDMSKFQATPKEPSFDHLHNEKPPESDGA